MGYKCFILLTIVLLSKLEAQILDDSTKNVYGRHSVRYFYARDHISGRHSSHRLDSTLRGVHAISVPQKSGYARVYLGNLGSASRAVLPGLPSTIGARAGLGAFGPLFLDFDKVQFFETRSPYTKLAIHQGAQGRAHIDIGYTRNIRKGWNMGVRMRRIVSDKQIGTQRRRGDRDVVSGGYLAHMHYFNADSTYAIAFAFTLLDHKTGDTGGIDVEDGALPSSLFRYRTSNTVLSNASSLLWRQGWHVLQRISLQRNLHAFVDAQSMNTRFFFENTLDGQEQNIYINYYTSREKTKEKTGFEDYALTGGLAWQYKQWAVVPFVKARLFLHNTSLGVVKDKEWYIGVKGTRHMNHTRQWQWALEGLQGGYMQAKIGYQTNHLGIVGRYMRVKPTRIQSLYWGNHFRWQTDFKAIEEAQASMQGRFKAGTFSVQPVFKLRMRRNAILFDANKLPIQVPQSNLMGIIQGQLNMSYNWQSHIFANLSIIYSHPFAKNQAAWRLPSWRGYGDLSLIHI